MLNRLHKNRLPVSNVIADRAITSATVAESLEITERQWRTIESLLNILKPLQLITTLFCGDSHSPITMVRPLTKKVIEKHIILRGDDDTVLYQLKETLISNITKRFKLDWNEGDTLSKIHVSCFFDPQYKNLEHESIHVRQLIRTEVQRLLQEAPVPTVNKKKSRGKSALQFLYDEVTDNNDINIQFETYMAEPQLRFDLDPFDCWKARANKYPVISHVAKKYLTIPATLAMSERCFSWAGSIVTKKRNRLLPENVNTLVFLHQNKKLID